MVHTKNKNVVHMNLKGQIMPIEKGLASKIFLCAFEKPKSGYELGYDIYGHDHHRVRRIARELSGEGYFKAIKIEGEKHPKWLSNIDCIISKIEKEIIISDEYILKNILESKSFKFLLKEEIPKNLRDVQINSVDLILSLLDIIIIISEGNEIFRKLSSEIKTEVDYYNAINKMKEDAHLKERIHDIGKTLFEKYEDLPSDIIEDLPILFIISRRLLVVMKGFSDFGKKYYEIKPISDKISKIMET